MAGEEPYSGSVVISTKKPILTLWIGDGKEVMDSVGKLKIFSIFYRIGG